MGVLDVRGHDPQTAHEIVPEPAEMGDDGTSDPFCRLINQLTG